MITRLFSAALRGVEAQEVEVEVNARGADKPMVIIVGLAGCRGPRILAAGDLRHRRLRPVSR